jgi:hypothetical protein
MAAEFIHLDLDLQLHVSCFAYYQTSQFWFNDEADTLLFLETDLCLNKLVLYFHA